MPFGIGEAARDGAHRCGHCVPYAASQKFVRF
jgi:hypothetical protein